MDWLDAHTIRKIRHELDGQWRRLRSELAVSGYPRLRLGLRLRVHLRLGTRLRVHRGWLWSNELLPLQRTSLLTGR